MRYFWVLPEHPQRHEVESLIRQRYRDNFNAQLRSFPERLIALTHEQHLVAACSVQLADRQPLFSQVYLQRSLQHYVVNSHPLPDNAQLAEVGSMAAAAAAYLPELFCAVVKLLRPLGRTAVLFTATQALQKYFRRMGITLTQLECATPDVLEPAERGRWGSYYAHQPKVLAGWLEQGYVFEQHQVDSLDLTTRVHHSANRASSELCSGVVL